MKKKIILATSFFLLGSIQITDWIFFAYKGDNEKLNISDLNAKYEERFPPILQLYFHNPVVSTLVCFFLHLTAGLIFINTKKKIFFVLGILSFVLAFWELFSLM